MSFSVTVLTCEAGRTSGYLLEHCGRNILVDCGPGVTDKLHPLVSIERLDAVVITHAHADHCLDLMGLAYALRFPQPRDALVPLWFPAEMSGLLDQLDCHFGVPTLPAMRRPLSQSFEMHQIILDGTHCAEIVPGIELTTRAALHAVPSAALRFTDGTRTVAFSSDTGAADTISATAANSDLFICEATYLRATARELTGHGHLTARQAGEVANTAGARQLVLTHLSRLHDGPKALEDAQRHYRGQVHVATRGASYTLP